MKTTLPTDGAARKDIPLYSGVLKYAPAALAGVAKISKSGNEKHNPGQPLHHARGKSNDHGDCVIRHAIDVADIEAYIKRNFDSDPDVWYKKDEVNALLNEVSQLCWRALMWSQELHEKYGGAPLAPNARLPEPVNSNQKPVLVVGARICIKCGVDDSITGTVVSIHPTGTDKSLLRVDPEFSEQVWQASGTGELKAGEYGWFFSEKDVLQILS